MRRETEVWLAYVREDLLSADAMLAASRWSGASFHAQQAAEKVLKALYHERTGNEPPRIHNLVMLGRLVQMDEPWLPELDILSRVYLVTRYPGDAVVDEPPYGIDGEAAREYCTLAERVNAWVLEQLATLSSSE